jgi:hypothetical protein
LIAYLAQPIGMIEAWRQPVSEIIAHRHPCHEFSSDNMVIIVHYAMGSARAEHPPARGLHADLASAVPHDDTQLGGETTHLLTRCPA